MGVIDFLKTAVERIRFRAASGLAPNLFVENSVMPWETSFRALWPEDFRKNAAAYREWAYVCTRVIADGVSAVPLRLYVTKHSTKKSALACRPINKAAADRLMKKPGIENRLRKASSVEEVLEHPFLNIMRNVNPFFNRFDLIDHTVINLELMGNAYWYKRRDAFGLTRELWNIPAQYMWIVPDKETFIKGYVMQRFGSGGAYNQPFDESEIVHFKYVDPNNMYYGVSPLSAMAQAYNTQESLNTYTNAAFANMGRLEGMLTTDGTISDENFERLKNRFRQQYAGARNALKTLVMDQGVKYMQMAFKPVDMGTKETRRDVLERIAAAFRVPLAKLITEDVNKSNAEAAQEDFLRDTVVPRLTRLEEKINEKLMPEYGPEYFVAFENPLPEDREFRLNERSQNIKVGYTTRNEERAIDGLPPLPEGGDSLPSLDTAGTGAVVSGEPEPAPRPPVIPVDDPEN
jgi:HK97 family phage portal protein